jgi:hypothetical protein
MWFVCFSPLYGEVNNRIAIDLFYLIWTKQLQNIFGISGMNVMIAEIVK